MRALIAADNRFAFFAFTISAITIAIVMVVLVVAIRLAQVKLIETLNGSTLAVKRWGAVLLILVGIWLATISVWAERFAQIFLA